MKIGSLEHRDAFCRHFLQTYTEYDPNTLPWPVLDDEALHRLRSVPFWEEVFYTERRAGAIVAAFTEHLHRRAVGQHLPCKAGRRPATPS